MRISVIEGIFAQIYSSLAGPGSVFLTKFALLFDATAFHLGVLSAIGQLSQLFQPVGVAISGKSTSRKKAILRLLHPGRGVTLAFVFLPFLLGPLPAIWIFLGLFLVGQALQAIAGNMWVAWISDMFPIRIRGRFFSSRSQYLIVIGLATSFAFSVFIDLFGSGGAAASFIHSAIDPLKTTFNQANIKYAFAIAFLVAAGAGALSIVILARQPENEKDPDGVGFFAMFRAPLADRNFRRLLFYGIWWGAAVGIASPFWQPFMIRDLGMSMTEIQIYGAISVSAQLLVLKPWGRIIDQFGNKTCMRLAIILGGLNPMLWVFAGPHTRWIVYIEAATSGIMWSGAGIIATNFVLSIAPSGKRQIYSGVFGAFPGLAMMVTTLLSGALLAVRPGGSPIGPVTVFGLVFTPEQMLFAATALARWSTEIPLSWIEEPRAKPVRSAVYYIIQNAKMRSIHSLFFFLERNGKRKRAKIEAACGPGSEAPVSSKSKR